ncbi:MAG: class I SAM-dependent methyltransferase [Roseburia sp.]
MEYMGDSHWWNERFKIRKLTIMQHEKCLEEDMKYFSPTGNVLDIACGDGRNAIYLAELGYDVHAIDFSEEALNRLNYFCKEKNLKVKTDLVDLATWEGFTDSNKYDVIIINHYRLDPKLYTKLIDCLNTGGFLWVNGFREVPNDNPNITKSDLLSVEDFLALCNYTLYNKKEYEIDNRKFVRYMWQK